MTLDAGKPTPGAAPSWPPPRAERPSFYAEASADLQRELSTALPRETLRALHRPRPYLHAGIALSQVAFLVGGGTLAALAPGWLWLLGAAMTGLAMFNFTVLLHEVVHESVFERRRHPANRLLALLYAAPCGISPSQFARWHLDHHAQLGDVNADPKRHYLSPKRNRRWLKLLYWTPALFPIYFVAARRAASGYPTELQRSISRERTGIALAHLALLTLLIAVGGWSLAWKVHLFPLMFVFPAAFALNRLGQHYAIEPEDPAGWSTLMAPSRFWEAFYLCSSYHLEHHYFPRVPLYNLPRLHRELRPFFARHGLEVRTYGQLLRGWFLDNARPHSRW